MAERVTKDTFEAEVLKAEGKVLVDFYGDGCVPCAALMPHVHGFADVYGDKIKFCALNTTKARRLEARFQSREFKGDEVLQFRGVTKAFDERTLFSDVYLRVEGGERIALIGENGTGKTTLLNMLTGRESCDGGSIRLGPSVKWAYLEQVIYFDHPERNLVDTMLYAKKNITPQSARNRLAAYQFQGEDVFKSVSVLSGGELSRLRLCILMDEEIKFLILDEPTNHLDLPSKEVLQQALSEYEGTLIIVSHDRYLLDRVPNRIFAIENGKLTQYKGGYGDYLKARAEQGSEKAAPAHTKTDSEQKKQYNRGKEQRREDARRRKEYAEAEALIHTLEEELEAAKAEMSLDSVQNDYQRLQELCTLIEEKQQLLDATLDRWLIISEELGNL